MTSPEITDIMNDAKVASEPPEDTIKRLAKLPLLVFEQRKASEPLNGVLQGFLDRFGIVHDVCDLRASHGPPPSS